MAKGVPIDRATCTVAAHRTVQTDTCRNNVFSTMRLPTRARARDGTRNPARRPVESCPGILPRNRTRPGSPPHGFLKMGMVSSLDASLKPVRVQRVHGKTARGGRVRVQHAHTRILSRLFFFLSASPNPRSGPLMGTLGNGLGLGDWYCAWLDCPRVRFSASARSGSAPPLHFWAVGFVHDLDRSRHQSP